MANKNYTSESVVTLRFPKESYQYKRSKDKKAYLFTPEDDEIEREFGGIWIPKNLCSNWHQKDNHIFVDVPTWIVNQSDYWQYEVSANPSLFVDDEGKDRFRNQPEPTNFDKEELTEDDILF